MKKIATVDFYDYVEDDFELWLRLKSAQVEHSIYGCGQVLNIEKIAEDKNKRNFKIEVRFPKTDTKKTFIHHSFKNSDSKNPFTQVSISDIFLQERRWCINSIDKTG